MANLNIHKGERVANYNARVEGNLFIGQTLRALKDVSLPIHAPKKTYNLILKGLVARKKDFI